ncbi:MAG: hypothetical protein ABWY58_10835 [Aeromicrobium sp.]
MKRLIIAAVLAVSLGALVGVSVHVLTTGGSGGPRVVEAMPYPRTTSPLPVPEVSIRQEPWRDPLPSSVPARPVPAEGFVTLCKTGSSQPAELRACPDGLPTGIH